MVVLQGVESCVDGLRDEEVTTEHGVMVKDDTQSHLIGMFLNQTPNCVC